MTLAELAQDVCNKVGQTDDASIALCKTFLQRRYKTVWNRYNWREAMAIGTITTTAASGYALAPADFEVVQAIRYQGNTAFESLDPLTLFQRHPEAWDASAAESVGFYQAGRAADISTTSTQYLSVAWTATTQSEIPLGENYNVEILNPSTGLSIKESTTPSLSNIVGVPQFINIAVLSSSFAPIIRSFSRTTTGELETDVSLVYGVGETPVGLTLTQGQTESPRRPLIRLVTVPTAAKTLLAFGKRRCNGLDEDGASPEILGIDDALLAFAEGDMLARQRQRGKANLCYQEASALIQSMLDQERDQTASNLRVVPFVEGYSTYGFRDKSYF